MKSEPVEFQVDGLRLCGNLYSPKIPKNLAVLFLHGWTGKPNELAAKMLAENGYTTMVFSFRGHNNSDGKLEEVTRDNSLKEAIAAYDFLVSQLSPDRQVAVAGSSYGSYTATLLSSKRKIKGVSLRVPANYPDDHSGESQLPQSPDTGNTTLTEWRKQMINYSDTKSLRSLHDFDGSVQIIEAENDEVVPDQTVQNYVNAVKDKSKLDYHFMEGWPHSLGDDPERNRQYQEILLNWLNKLLETV